MGIVDFFLGNKQLHMRELKVAAPASKVYQALLAALPASGFTVKQSDPVNGFIEATTGSISSMLFRNSMGETLGVKVEKVGEMNTYLKMGIAGQATGVMGFGADWQTKQNAENLFNKLQKNLSKAFGPQVAVTQVTAEALAGEADKLRSSPDYKLVEAFAKRALGPFEASYLELAREQELTIKEAQRQGSAVLAEEALSMFDWDGPDGLRQNLAKRGADTEKLKHLLGTKGYVFTQEDFDSLVLLELFNQQYVDFKEKMAARNTPKTVDGYFAAFLDIYGERAPAYTFALLKAFEEAQLGLDAERVATLLDRKMADRELEQYEKVLTAPVSGPVTLAMLDAMAGVEFEGYLRDLFTRMGYKVELTKTTGDQGADLVVTQFGEKSVVQAKRYSGKVGNDAIQQAVAATAHYGATKAIVVTTAEFTRSAIELALSNRVQLIDREDLEKLMAKHL